MILRQPRFSISGLLVVTLIAACEAPHPQGIDRAPGSVGPTFGGGGTTPTPPTPPGLDTLPAPAAPAGSPSSSPRVIVFALTDSTGAAALQLGPVTGAILPNVTCFASPNPNSTPWVAVPAGAVLSTPYCIVRATAGTAVAVFGGLRAGEYVATVARF
jgi:hypothetical protein